MSRYRAGMRVRIDEGLTGEDDHPYNGIGHLVSKNPGGEGWRVDLEWLVDVHGNQVAGWGEYYHVFEGEIAEVLDD